MANRRKFLAGLGALASGSAAAMGTGAFSSIEADRTMTTNVVSDEDAYLALEANPNSSFATGSDSGTIEFAANQLNLDAYTEFADAFRITNNGSRRARVWIDISDVPSDLSMTIFGVEDGAYNGGPGPSLGVAKEDEQGNRSGGPSDLGPGQGVFIDPGSTVKVSPAFGAFDGSVDPVSLQDVTLTIYAVTEDSEIVGLDLFDNSSNNANTEFEPDVNPNLVSGEEHSNSQGGSYSS